jgi:glycosyltransferase involved in cell wall biosynthesis
MKLLVIGRTYATAFSQEKFAAMKAIDPDLKLCIIVPTHFGHFSKKARPAERHPALADDIATFRIVAGKPPSTYFFNPFHLAKKFKKFSPDVVLIDEDPHSVLGAETCFLMGLFCPSAKRIFFTWDNLARDHRFPFGFIKRALTKYGFSKTSLIVCGNSEAQRLLAPAKNYTGSSVVLPQLGIEPFAARQTPIAKVSPIIGFVGRLVPEKGLVLLLEALSQLKHLEWELNVIGSGPLESEIQGRWQSAFGDRLKYRAAVPHSGVADCLRALDIFVLPSLTTPRWKEQFGLTLAQAMMAGAACVGSSSGAIPEVLGNAGVIFEEGNRKQLQDVLSALITSPARRQELAQAGWSRAMAQFSHSVVSARYLAALKHTLHDPNSALPPRVRFSEVS